MADSHSRAQAATDGEALPIPDIANIIPNGEVSTVMHVKFASINKPIKLQLTYG